MNPDGDQFLDDYGDEGDDVLGFYEGAGFMPDADADEVDDLDLEEFNDELNHDARDDMVELTQTVEATLRNPQSAKAFRTRSDMTRFEKAALIGIRAEQLARGMPPYVSIEEYDPVNKTVRIMSDPTKIAEKELAEGKMPLSIDRLLPSKVANYPTKETRTAATLIHTTNPNF